MEITDFRKNVNEAIKLHEMFLEQSKSEMRCINNLLRDAFEPYLVMLESNIKQEGYFLFPDIRLSKTQNKYRVLIDLMWYLVDSAGAPEALILTKKQEICLGDILTQYAADINMWVKCNV